MMDTNDSVDFYYKKYIKYKNKFNQLQIVQTGSNNVKKQLESIIKDLANLNSGDNLDYTDDNVKKQLTQLLHNVLVVLNTVVQPIPLSLDEKIKNFLDTLPNFIAHDYKLKQYDAFGNWSLGTNDEYTTLVKILINETACAGYKIENYSYSDKGYCLLKTVKNKIGSYYFAKTLHLKLNSHEVTCVVVVKLKKLTPKQPVENEDCILRDIESGNWMFDIDHSDNFIYIPNQPEVYTNSGLKDNIAKCLQAMVVHHSISDDPDDPDNQQYTQIVTQISVKEKEIQETMTLITQEKEFKNKKAQSVKLPFQQEQYDQEQYEQEHYAKIRSLEANVNTLVNELKTLLRKAIVQNNKAFSQYVSWDEI